MQAPLFAFIDSPLDTLTFSTALKVFENFGVKPLAFDLWAKRYFEPEERMATIDCHHCGGVGADDCPDCEGTGQRRDGEDCRKCDGWGRVDCGPCGGEGYIFETFLTYETQVKLDAALLLRYGNGQAPGIRSFAWRTEPQIAH